MGSAKISIAIDEEQLVLARAAAASEGTSLSAYIGRALGRQLDEQRRLEAARELHASWGEESAPTDAEKKAFALRMRRRKGKKRPKAA